MAIETDVGQAFEVTASRRRLPLRISQTSDEAYTISEAGPDVWS